MDILDLLKVNYDEQKNTINLLMDLYHKIDKNTQTKGVKYEY
jgi:hypothetical protein